MKRFENRINVIRGTIDYYYLAGPDPPSSRPKWFVVTPRNSTFVTNEVSQSLYSLGVNGSVVVNITQLSMA